MYPVGLDLEVHAMADGTPIDLDTELDQVFLDRFGRAAEHHDEMVLPPGTFHVESADGEVAAPLPGCVIRFIVDPKAPVAHAGLCSNSGELTSWRIVRSPQISVFPLNVWAYRLEDVRACLERLNDGAPARNPDAPNVATSSVETPVPEAGGTAHDVAVEAPADADDETTADANPS